MLPYRTIKYRKSLIRLMTGKLLLAEEAVGRFVFVSRFLPDYLISFS